MLSNITWAQFLTATGVLVILYYVAILLKFKAVKSLLLKRKNTGSPIAVTERPISSNVDPTNDLDYSRFKPTANDVEYVQAETIQEDPDFEAASVLSERIKTFLVEAAHEQLDREQVRTVLRTFIYNAPVSKKPVYKIAIRHLIESELKNHELFLSEEMIDALWK